MPADGAEVYRLDGPPPADMLPITGEDGCLEFLFCHRGGLRLELSSGQRLELCAGQALCLPGWAGGGRCRFDPAPFQGILVREGTGAALASLAALWPGLGRQRPERGHGCVIIRDVLWCETLFAALEKLPEARRGNYCTIKVLELLYLFHAGAGTHASGCLAAYHDQHQRRTVQEIHDYILEHLDRRLTIRQLSLQFHISETLLKTCFRQLYGAPIHQYFLKRRMARAAQLLCSTDQTVLEIAFAVGYSSVGQFGIAFKSQYHMPPAQFRRNAGKMSITDCSGPNGSESSG